MKKLSLHMIKQRQDASFQPKINVSGNFLVSAPVFLASYSAKIARNRSWTKHMIPCIPAHFCSKHFFLEKFKIVTLTQRMLSLFAVSAEMTRFKPQLHTLQSAPI